MAHDDTWIGPPADTDLAGSMVDEFRVERLLGAGGMGRVYKALDTKLHRQVALKVIAPGVVDPEFLARFERETHALSAVNHPNVAQIYSAGTVRGRPYYAMEFIDGESLGTVLDAGRHLSGRRCLRYMVQAAEGMRAASMQNLIHRDIKPQNLVIDRSDRLKIVDFGLARWTNEDVSLTPTAVALGTPRYIAPEQAMGQKCDLRSDIYSLGATFYHLFAGVPPFVADTPVALLVQHISTPLPPLRSRNPRVPRSVAAIIEKMMAKQPSDRYQTWDELIADLVRVDVSSEVAHDAPTVATDARQRAIPKREIAFAAAGAISLLLALTIFLSRSDFGTKESEDAPAIIAATGAAKDSASPIRDGPVVDSAVTSLPPTSPQAPVVISFPQVDPGPMMDMARRAQTLANMRKIAMLSEVARAQKERYPDRLDTLASEFGAHPRELLDGWKHPITYEVVNDRVRLASAGADGIQGNTDDIVMEDSMVTQGDEP